MAEARDAEANAIAEYEAEHEMAGCFKSEHGDSPTTLGADKGYDNDPILIEPEARKLVLHISMTSEDPTEK